MGMRLERRRGEAAEQVVLAGAVAAAVALYAFRNATYDVVARSEAALIMAWLVVFGLALGLLPRTRPPWTFWLCLGGFSALALWTAASFGWTVSDERTSAELARVVHHALAFVLVACIATRANWASAVAGLTVGLCLVTWIALVAWLWPSSIGTDQLAKTFGTRRLNYPLDYWNGMGFFAAMTAGAALAWAGQAQAVAWRCVAAAQVPVAVAVIYLTYSRGAAGALAGALLLGVAFAANRWTVVVQAVVVVVGSALVVLIIRDHPEIARGTGSSGAVTVLLAAVGAGLASATAAFALWRSGFSDRARLSPRRAHAALAAGLLTVVAGAVLVGPGLVDRARDSFTGRESASSSDPASRLVNLGGGRDEQYAAALDAFAERPWRGSGPGTFEFSWNRDPRYGGFVRDVHSLYLEALAELGVPGLVAVLILIAGALAILVQSAGAARDATSRGAVAAAAAVFGAFLVASAIDWAWELTVLPFVTFVAIGFVSAGAGSATRAPSPRGLVLRWGAAALAVVALIVVLLPLASTSAVRASQAAAARGDFREARAKADEAVAVSPWAATPFVQRGLVQESHGDLALAAANLELAIEREPTNWRLPAVLARIEASRGDPAASLRWFRRARELAPRNPLLR